MKSEKSLSRVERFCVSVCSSNRIMVDVLAGRLSGRVSCIFAIQMLGICCWLASNVGYT